MSNVIVDTNAFIDGLDPCDYKKVYLISTTIEELDELKRNRNETLARSAKQAIKRIVKAYDDGIIEFRSKYSCYIPLDLSIPDNRILAYAKDICAFDPNAVLVSADHNVILKAKCLDIPHKYFGTEKNEICSTYSGYREITVSDEYLAKLYQNDIDIEGMLINEYLVVRDVNGVVVDKFRKTDKGFIPVKYKAVDSFHLEKIKPRNTQQELAFDLLQNTNIPVKALFGKFGVGKDLLMAAHALNQIKSGGNNKPDSILFIRNNINVRGTKDLGALPGTEFDKILPFLMPFADHVGGVDGLRMLINSRALEVQHLGFIRGRSIKNKIVIVSEAENLTAEHVALLLGRIDENSQIWFNGDFKQIDDCVFEKNNGLKALIDGLKGERLFGCVQLTINERSEVARLSDKIKV